MGTQISIFVENKPGKISRITGILEKARLNLRASTVADSGHFGILKIITDHNDKAYAALRKAGVMVSRQDVVLVEIPDRVGAFHTIARFLENQHINIEDVHCILIGKTERAVLVLKVSETKKVERLLKGKKYRILSDNEL